MYANTDNQTTVSCRLQRAISSSASRLCAGCVLLITLFFAQTALSSDHADPIMLKTVESGITGLFLFPEDNRMQVILTVRRGLTQPAPFDLSKFRYRVNFDTHSKVSFDNAQDRARYGGTIVAPNDIKADSSIEIRLNDDASLSSKVVTGLNNSDDIRIYTGVRDDPFIFPKFFGTNVIAMVISMPMTAFPDGQQVWLVWATSSDDKGQIDHVGRSLRTMLPRFDKLNTLPPSEHVRFLNEQHTNPSLLQDIARTFIGPLFALRQYDFAPDVMIYSKRLPVGFPNGRRLTDDVAALTCEQGECLLWEQSYANSKVWPRKTVNDRLFLGDSPYLGEPWPNKKPAPDPELTSKNKFLLGGIAVLLLGFIVLPWVLFLRCRSMR
jgi:hypothetical protein